MTKRLTLLIFALSTTISVWSQTKIKGIVTSKEEKSPILGVNVVIKGTNIGTITETDGTFAIEVSNPNDTLVFQYIGMVTKEFPLIGQTQIHVVTKWDCYKDFFDSQLIDVYVSSGIINTPIGGQIEIASPWVLGGVIKGLYNYQTNLNENKYHNGQIEFTHYISNCNFDIDFRWSYRHVFFDNSINFKTNSIETDINTGKIKLIAGYTHLNFNDAELMNEMNDKNLSGILIGYGTYISMPLYPEIVAKISFYKDKIEYQSAIQGRFKRFQCFIKFYKLNSFNELSVGIGTWIGYRFKRQK